MAQFYSYFGQLCQQKGVSMNKAAIDMGLARTLPQKWKKGFNPSFSSLEAISKYFGIPVEEVMGMGESAKKDPPTGISERNYEALLKLDEIVGKNSALLDEIIEFAQFRESKMGKG